MPTYDSGGFITYIGQSGLLSLGSTTDFDNTATDGVSDTMFEVGDVAIGGAEYRGFITVAKTGGGTIDLPGFFFGGNFVFLFPQANDVADFVLPDPLDTATQVTASGFTVCFAAGTQILTPQGEICVETLKISDCVLNARGAAVDVKWIGRQTIRYAQFQTRTQLVRISAGAMGEGLPRSDLTVTADHGMVLDGYVINASALVNGDTIDWVPMAELEDSFAVYHVETENHDVILANGTAAETFIDAADRTAFDNYGEYLELYGADRIIPQMPLPRISSPRLVPQTIRDRLRPSAPHRGVA